MDAVEIEAERLVGVTGVPVGESDYNIDGVHAQAIGTGFDPGWSTFLS